MAPKEIFFPEYFRSVVGGLCETAETVQADLEQMRPNLKSIVYPCNYKTP